MSELLKIDKDYKEWIEEISHNFKKFQIKASASVNVEMLKFYWIVGKGIQELSQKNNYGSKLIDNISNDLKKKLPNVQSFSPRNLRYMSSFYKFLSELEILPQLGAKSQNTIKMPQVGAELDNMSNSPQHGVKPRDLLAFMIPWGHMKVILDKYKNDKERAMFYIKGFVVGICRLWS